MAQKTMRDIETVVADVNAKRGGWPSHFDFRYAQNELIVEWTELTKSQEKKQFRGLDTWGLAFWEYVNQQAQSEDLHTLSLVIGNAVRTDTNTFLLNLEALKRRVSFLNLNNEMTIQLIVKDTPVELYTTQTFLKRTRDVIRSSIPERTDQDVPGRLEKDLQAFLFGKGLEAEERTNERLAIFGNHFLNLTKKEFGILREFPTGVFQDQVSDTTRLLPAESVDIVTLNKWGELAVIELKLNGAPLEVIAQVFDYALFFEWYWKDLVTLIKKSNKSFKNNLKKEDCFKCYMVGNHFHRHFDRVFAYYIPKLPNIKFKLFKVTLGYTEEPQG